MADVETSAPGETRPLAWIRPDAAGIAALEAARARTLWQAISDAAALDRDRDALVAADDHGVVQRLSYGQRLDRVRHFSAGLASIGVQRGSNSTDWKWWSPKG